MDYNRVAMFVRVVKAGSFTVAAAEVGTPKSTVSRSVSHLEEELGVRLLQRTTRKLTLTQAGRAFFDAVSGAVAAIDEADRAARDHEGEPRGVVRMTAPPAFAGLAVELADFGRMYPLIRIELALASRHVDLVAEGFDLAVRAGQLNDSSLVARRIGPTDMALMASPAYLQRRGRPRSVAELPAFDWVLYRASAGRATLQLTGPDGKHAVEVAGALAADDLAFCRAAVEAGAGLALMPVHAALESLRAGTLEVVLPGFRYDGASLYVVLPTARQIPARVRLLRDFLVERLGKQLAVSAGYCQRARRGKAAAG